MKKQVLSTVVFAAFLWVGCQSHTGSSVSTSKATTSGPERQSAAPMHGQVVGGNSKHAAWTGPHIDWNVTTTAPVIASPAVTGADFNVGLDTDVFAFGVANSGTARGITASGDLHAGWNAAARDAGIFVLTNIYDASLKPDLLTYALDDDTAQKFTSGGLVLNVPGTKLYALSQTGKLFCFEIPTSGPVGGAATRASACAGWTDYTAGTTVSYSSVWPMYADGEVATVYFGDDNGNLHKVDGSTGASAWGGGAGPLAATGASALASPVVVTDTGTGDNVAYVGDSKGRYFRWIDAGSTPVAGGASSYDLCEGAPGTCATNPWGIVTSPTIDITIGTSYVVAGGKAFEFPVAATGAWEPTTSPKTIGTSPSMQFRSTPILDPDLQWLYVGYNNRLFKLLYPFDGNPTTDIHSSPVQAVGADASYPHGTPLPYEGTVWIGSGTGADGDGLVEQYGCGANGEPPKLTGQSTLNYGAYVSTPIVMDFVTGNVGFGYRNAAGTAGGAVQYLAATGGADWVCPGAQTTVATAACGSPGCTVACVLDGDCSANNKDTTTCDNGVCVGACSANYGDCNGDLTTDGCEADLASDASHCGACGNACSGGLCSGGICAPPFSVTFDGPVITALHVGTSWYFGGQFTSVGGTSANAIVKLDDTTFAVDTVFSPPLLNGFTGPSPVVFSLATDGTSLFVGGSFTEYRGVADSANSLAKLDLATGDIDVTFSPPGAGTNGVQFGGIVIRLLMDGTSLYLGGAFASYRSTPVGYIAKIDSTTGVLDPAFPVGTGFNDIVYALATDGTSIFAGGAFTTYDGLTDSARRIAKLDPTTGAIDTAFSPVGATSNGFDGAVQGLLENAGSLYATGSFNAYRGVANSANNLAKLDVTTGAIDTVFSPVGATSNGFNGGTNLALAVSGTSLYVGGDFDTYKGVANSANSIAKLDLASGAIDTTFSPVGLTANGFGATETVFTIIPTGGSLIATGTFTTYRGTAVSTVVRLNETNGLRQ